MQQSSLSSKFVVAVQLYVQLWCVSQNMYDLKSFELYKSLSYYHSVCAERNMFHLRVDTCDFSVCLINESTGGHTWKLPYLNIYQTLDMLSFCYICMY